MVIRQDGIHVYTGGGSRARRGSHKCCRWLTGRDGPRSAWIAPNNCICRTTIILRLQRTSLLLLLLLNKTIPPSSSARTPQLRHLPRQRVVFLPNFRSTRRVAGRVAGLERLRIVIRVDGVRLVTDLQHRLWGADVAGRRRTARLTGTTWTVSVDLPLAGGAIDNRV